MTLSPPVPPRTSFGGRGFRGMFTIRVYKHDAEHAFDTEHHASARDARRAAARLLGHRSLRGASSWAHPHGGVVYQFGPRTEDNDHDFVVVVDDD